MMKEKFTALEVCALLTQETSVHCHGVDIRLSLLPADRDHFTRGEVIDLLLDIRNDIRHG